MKAIQIRFLPATNFKGARVKAFTEGGNSLILPYQYGNGISNAQAQAEDAAQELIYKMQWDVKISGAGQIANGDWVVTLT